MAIDLYAQRFRDLAELRLRAMKKPVTLTGGSRLRYRVRKTGPTATLTVYLMQGTTVIASWSHASLNVAYTTYEQVLTDPQAALITDYTNLRVRLVANS